MLRSEIPFAAFLAYSPRGDSDAAERSRYWVRCIKNETLVTGKIVEPMSARIAARLKARIADTPFAHWLGPDVLIVPVPPSALLKSGSLWVPYAIAQALVGVGLGSEALPCVQRVQAVRKSATADPDDRPSAETHYDSLRVKALAFPHAEIVVLDDVVTRGATLLATVSRVQAVVPGARVRGFAIVRTISNPAEFTEMLAPVVGSIALGDDGQTRRRP